MKQPFLFSLFILFTLLLLCAACGVDDDSPTPQGDGGGLAYFNSKSPNANDLVLQSQRFGNETSYSAFSFSEKSSDGGFYTLGVLDVAQASTNINVGIDDFDDYFEYTLMKFDANGQQVWQKRPGFWVQRMTVVPEGVLAEEEIIVLVGYDENEENYQDESPDRSRIMLFDASGNFIDNYYRDFFLSLFDVKLVENKSDHARFVGVGSVHKTSVDGNYYPGFFEFKINKFPLAIDSSSVFTTQLLDTKWRHLRFWNLELTEAGNYIVSGSHYKEEEYTEVHTFAFDPQDYDDPIWWEYYKNPALINHWREGLTVVGDKVYVSGDLKVRIKPGGEACSGSDCPWWSTPYVISYDTNSGDMDWVETYPFSQTSDKIYRLEESDGLLYTVGIESYSFCSNCDDFYNIGNGIVLKLNKEGDLLSKKSFGDVDYRTLFKTFVLNGDHLWIVGETSETVYDARGLIVRLSKSAL